MRYWRVALWLVPASTAIPLSSFVYQLLTTDFSAYFGDVRLVGLIVVVGIPNLVVVVASVIAAVYAGRGHPFAALLIVSAICAWSLTTLLWNGSFWDSHSRFSYLLIFGVPGAVAGVLGVWGLLRLRTSNRTVATVAGILLLIPVAGSGGAVVQYALESARECPPGPPVDLTFIGLETGHFTSSCGLSNGISTLTGCNTTDATVGLFNGQLWYLRFVRADQPVTSDRYPYRGPDLITGANTSYGEGTTAWKGSYSYDPGSRCAGTVDAYLYPTGRGPEAGSVHVTGHFAAPE